MFKSKQTKNKQKLKIKAKYPISRPIRRTVIFLLEILEKKIVMNVF